MQLVEQHIIIKTDPRFALIDAAAFAAKNLYNAANYSGERVHRGLYRAKDGRCMHADVNGAYTILRKALPDAFGNGIEGIAVCPLWLHVGSLSPVQGAGSQVSHMNQSKDVSNDWKL